MGSTLPWVSILLIACMAVSSSVVAAVAPNGQLFGQINRIPASSIPPPSSSQLQQQFLVFRGGAASDEYDSDEYDSEYDSDEEEEPIVTKAKKLATSTKSATQKKALKQTAVKTAALKSKVSVAMASSSSSSKPVAKKKGVYKRFVPYIVRACLNPFTLVAMTKAFFVSLMDINYLNKEEPSQNLRSALEEKARKQQPGPTKPKRKMKPGQAKTISDLPQLSA
uniref:Transmembrane protein n=1 Tax=Skeletonema marinoi TaxID=267567 RepID=A0A7S2M0E6_9STRA